MLAPVWSKAQDSDIPATTAKVMTLYREGQAKKLAAEASRPEETVVSTKGDVPADLPEPEVQDAPKLQEGVASQTMDNKPSGRKGPPKSIQERFPIGCIVVGAAARMKGKYDNVRGEVIGHPGFLHSMVKVMLLSGEAKGTKHDYIPENVTLEST